MLKLKWSCLIGLVAVGAMVGCGGSSADFEATAPVSGKITYNGTPVAMAVVTFTPEEQGGNAASGVTDGQGNYVLTTFQAEDGAVPGAYRVTVTKKNQSKQGGAESTEEDPGAAYLEMEAQGQDITGGGGAGDVGAGAQEAQDLLPLKYKSRDSTDLKADVSDSGGSDYNFDLVD